MDSPNVPAAAARPTPRRLDWRLLLALVPGLALLGYFAGSRFFPTTDAGAQPSTSDTVEIRPTGELPPGLFKRWGNVKPDLALVISGQTYGYLQECGCSNPQYGGLVRRYNLIQMLKRKGWAVTAVDLGDLAPVQKDGLQLLESQAMEQYRTTLKAMNAMDYEVFGLGVLEMKMPIFSALIEADNLKLAKPKPMTLNFDDPQRVFEQLGVQQYAMVNKGGVKVGLTSLVGASLQLKLAGLQNVKFIPNNRFLPVALQKLKEKKADVSIVFLHSDYSQPNAAAPPANAQLEAEKCAEFCDDLKKKNPQCAPVDLIVYASADDVAPALLQQAPDPAAKGKWLDAPRLLLPGHKGKYVGVVGLFKQPTGGYEIKYELVSLGPEFKTVPGAEKNHPVMALMDEYAETVKKMDFLAEYGAKFRTEHPTQKVLAAQNVTAKFVGSAECARCHEAEYAVWEKSKHAMAYDVGLVKKAKHPSGRQFDPECVACHVTGFKYKTGFGDPPAGANPAKIAKHFDALKNVGCESCHGPGSMHANDPKNKAFHDLINPIKLTNPRSLQMADAACQKCHDIENDVNWGAGRFAKAWKEIEHTNLNNWRKLAIPANHLRPNGGADDPKSAPRP